MSRNTKSRTRPCTCGHAPTQHSPFAEHSCNGTLVSMLGLMPCPCEKFKALVSKRKKGGK